MKRPVSEGSAEDTANQYLEKVREGDDGASSFKLVHLVRSPNISDRVRFYAANANWVMILYIGSVHVLGLYAVFVLLLNGTTGERNGHDVLGHYLTSAGSEPVKRSTMLFGIFLYVISLLGITAGVHRLWAHRSYEASFGYRLLLMLMSSMANQKTIYNWARDHRTHHLYSDTVRDPHNSNNGWFYCHVGWVLVKKDRCVVEAGKKIDISDLKRDPVVMLQERCDPWWNAAWCYLVPALLSVYLFKDTFWNGFLVAGVLRCVWTWHCTWAVNSITHSALFEEQPTVYGPGEPPCESRLVSFITNGEGWHSWHHAFPHDYTAAELGYSLQWNPTTMFIDLAASLGQVWNRKRASALWEARKRLWEKKRNSELISSKTTLVLRETLTGPPLFKVRGLEWGFEPNARKEADEVQFKEAISSTATPASNLHSESLSSGSFDDIEDDDSSPEVGGVLKQRAVSEKDDNKNQRGRNQVEGKLGF